MISLSNPSFAQAFEVADCTSTACCCSQQIVWHWLHCIKPHAKHRFFLWGCPSPMCSTYIIYIYIAYIHPTDMDNLDLCTGCHCWTTYNTYRKTTQWSVAKKSKSQVTCIMHPLGWYCKWTVFVFLATGWQQWRQGLTIVPRHAVLIAGTPKRCTQTKWIGSMLLWIFRSAGSRDS